MFILYAVYVACTIALVVAAIGVARHIIVHRRTTRSHSDHSDESL